MKAAAWFAYIDARLDLLEAQVRRMRAARQTKPVRRHTTHRYGRFRWRT